MNRREIFKKTINHQSTARVLKDLDGCPLSGMSSESRKSLMDFLGIKGDHTQKNEELLKHLNIDTRGVGYLIEPPSILTEYISETEQVNSWGIHQRFTGLYWEIDNAPLKGANYNDLLSYPFPKACAIDIKPIEAELYKAKELYNNTDYIICGEHPVFGIFELGCWMCGFDDFLLKMALDTDFIRRFFDIILDYQKQVIEMYYGILGDYIHYTSSGDDFATQQSSFISPAMFEELIFPYLKERIDYTKKFTDAAFLHHSCGDVSNLLDMLIKAGVDIINPIQPVNDNMDPKNLKNRFGDFITFHGGVDTQQILRIGTPDEVKAYTTDLTDVFSKDGGYILAAAHNLQGDIPPENILAMFE